MRNKDENQDALKTLLQEGNKLKDEGKLIEAEKKYSEILKLQSDSVSAINQLAGIYEEKKEYDKVIHNLEHFLKLKPNNLIARGRLARALTKLGQIQEGLENYKKALSLNSDIPAWIYEDMGDIFYQKGQFDQAADSYRQVTELRKDRDPLGYKKLGDTLQYLGRIDEAIAAYQKAISLRPEKTEFSEALSAVEERHRIQLEFGGQLNSHPLIISVKNTITVAAVTVIKNEGDIIYSNLLWHYSMGIKKFVILDNLSTDNTVTEVKRFADNYPNASLYLMEDREIGHYQGKKLTAAAEFAHSMWKAEWILPFDGDEILCSLKASLQEVLASLNKEDLCISLPWRNHVLRTCDDYSKSNPLQRMTYRQKSDFLGVKVMIRWKPGMVIAQGNHKVRYKGEISCVLGQELGLLLRHYRFRSKNHLQQKFMNKGKAYEAAADLPESTGPLQKKWYKEYLEGGERFIEGFYNKEVNDHKNAVYDPVII